MQTKSAEKKIEEQVSFHLACKAGVFWGVGVPKCRLIVATIFDLQNLRKLGRGVEQATFRLEVYSNLNTIVLFLCFCVKVLVDNVA